MPDKFEKIEIEKEYFSKRNSNDTSIYSINKFLRNISEKNNIKLLENDKILCDNKTKRCVFFTNNDEKIYFDGGHYTIAGAKYVGQKIYQMNWFEID